MKGLRNKILITMIVYFAGFASAIYYLAPGESTASAETPRFSCSLDAEGIKSSLACGINKCKELANGKAALVGEFIKSSISDKNEKDTEQQSIQ